MLICLQVKKGVPQVLVRWSLQRGYVIQTVFVYSVADSFLCVRFVPLPKSAQPERVVSNANVYDFELSPADMEKIDALDEGTAGAISWNPIDAE